MGSLIQRMTMVNCTFYRAVEAVCPPQVEYLPGLARHIFWGTTHDQSKSPICVLVLCSDLFLSRHAGSLANKKKCLSLKKKKSLLRELAVQQ